MSNPTQLLGTGAALAAAMLAGCATAPPLPNTPAALDSAYGIPPGSVPPSVERLDGMLINGLLPAQPDDGS